jgi:hypothetical protein
MITPNKNRARAPEMESGMAPDNARVFEITTI